MKLKKIPFQMRDIWRITKGKGIDFDSRPQKPKKFFSRLIDLLIWYLKHGEVQYFYYLFGFDAKSRKEQNEYFSVKEYYRLMSAINKKLVGGVALDYAVLSHDKFVTTSYLQSLGAPHVRNEAFIIDNRVFWTEGGEDGLESLLNTNFEFIYIKPIHGGQGKQIICLEIETGQFYYQGAQLSVTSLEKQLLGQLWVVQKKVLQHSELEKFSSSAANTIRINTILKQGKSEFLSSVMRFSVGGSHVDNWHSGSPLVPIDHETGTLREKGYYEPKKYIVTTIAEHPDSKIPFKGYKIPFYEEAVEIALWVHKFYYYSFILGFDFVVTEKGPLIIEINPTPSPSLAQFSHDNGIKGLIL